jgi:hypothetical protein
MTLYSIKNSYPWYYGVGESTTCDMDLYLNTNRESKGRPHGVVSSLEWKLPFPPAPSQDRPARPLKTVEALYIILFNYTS